MTVYSGCRRCGTRLVVKSLDAPQVCQMCPPMVDPFDKALDNLSGAINRFMTNQSDGSDIDWLAGQCQAMEFAPPRLGEAALAYAAWGWPVFPLLAAGKRPASKHGFQDATCDVATIRRWWGIEPPLHELDPRNARFNIGIATGIAFDVIDVDPYKGGDKTWAALRLQPSLPDIHGRVITRSGGFHCYVEITGVSNRQAIYPGIDYRGRGGYVVAPPSQVPIADDDSGSQLKSYTWSVYPSPTIIPARGGVYEQ